MGMGEKFRRCVEIYRHKGLKSLLLSIDRYLSVRVLKTFPIFFVLISAFHPKRPMMIFYPTTNGWKIWEKGEGVFYVSSYNQVYRGSAAWRDWKLDRYSYNGFVEPEVGDTIVDIGAFRGEFTLAVAPIAERVVSFEPDPQNLGFLVNNVNKFNNIGVSSIGLWKENKIMSFNMGGDSTDSSILDIDSNQTKSQIHIQARRVNQAFDEIGMESVDFVKLDAEGAEPEVVTGIPDSNIDKIAVDCTSERYGESTTEEVQDILLNNGFEVRVSENNVVFGRYQNQ